MEKIRTLFGGTIGLDPFGSEHSNKTVQAEKLWTIFDNGFIQPWDAKSALINPPGLKVRLAWDKLLDEYQAGRLQSAAWIGFSVEQLCLLSDPEELFPLDFTTVILRKRISFVKEDGTTGSPSHGNYVSFPGVAHDLVVSHFSELGRVLPGSKSII